MIMSDHWPIIMSVEVRVDLRKESDNLRPQGGRLLWTQAKPGHLSRYQIELDRELDKLAYLQMQQLVLSLKGVLISISWSRILTVQ